MPIEISESSFEDIVRTVFGHTLQNAFNNAENWSVSSTGKVNSQSFRKACFIETPVSVQWKGKTVSVNLLQIYCKMHGVDIRGECLTRSKAISPLLEAVSGYLEVVYPALRWHSDKPQNAREERMSLDDLLA